MTDGLACSANTDHEWPAEGLSRIPDWVYTDETIYQREVERIFHGRTWNYVALEAEIAKPAISSAPMSVRRRSWSRAIEDGAIHVVENRCAHRAAEFCRELTGNVKEFVCPYHQWTYELNGACAACRSAAVSPARAACLPTSILRGTDCGGSTSPRIVASYSPPMPTIWSRSRIISARISCANSRRRSMAGELRVLGHYRHTLPGNWKLYHENLKDPYHATLLHTFLVTFGLLVAGNRSLMLADAVGPPWRDVFRQVRCQGGCAGASRRRCAPTRRAWRSRTLDSWISSTSSTAHGR